MRTSAARVRAGRIRVPRINIAVDRTRSMVATDFFGSIGASLATVKRLGQNASLRVGTGTARYTANSTGVIVLNIPVSDNTVNRAIDRIASLSLKRSRASHATVNRLDHWAGTGLGSAAA